MLVVFFGCAAKLHQSSIENHGRGRRLRARLLDKFRLQSHTSPPVVTSELFFAPCMLFHLGTSAAIKVKPASTVPASHEAFRPAMYASSTPGN